MDDMIFVFGSNLSGRHGAGAALYALRNKGAVYGVGEGLAGQSYALPTLGYLIEPIPLNQIQNHINTFLDVANKNPYYKFQVTRVGCGLAGLKDSDVAPMFSSAFDNCYFDTLWKKFLPNHKFWGTF